MDYEIGREMKSISFQQLYTGAFVRTFLLPWKPFAHVQDSQAGVTHRVVTGPFGGGASLMLRTFGVCCSAVALQLACVSMDNAPLTGSICLCLSRWNLQCNLQY